MTTNDIYQQVTNQIIADLEKGQLTWRKPWSGDNFAIRPLRSNDVPYTGINTILLWATAAHRGYQTPHWMTFKQALTMKACVRKGEKSTQVIYADKTFKDDIDENGQAVKKEVPFVKVYSVFNASQIEGLPEAYYKTPEKPEPNADSRIEELERFFRETKADIITGTEAAYSISTDKVMMPPFESFESAPDYYAVLAHEITHWTRHPKRLNREFGRKKWGDEGYAQEELVAEIGACFLGADLGFKPRNEEQSAAYIQNWLEVLRNDKKFIFQAAAHAQRATEYLIGLQKPAASPVPAPVIA